MKRAIFGLFVTIISLTCLLGCVVVPSSYGPYYAPYGAVYGPAIDVDVAVPVYEYRSYHGGRYYRGSVNHH